MFNKVFVLNNGILWKAKQNKTKTQHDIISLIISDT